VNRSILMAGAVGAALVLRTASAMAAYGAFALDNDAHKYGYSWNKESAREADAAALKGCATDGCKVVFRTGPKQCGAIALTADASVWGGAQRGERAAAELAAVENCEKRTKGQCKIKAAACNQ
jgi:hypothetical protein